MPQGPMASPLMRPFVVLALPGMYLFYKYNQYKRRRRESARRRLTERELQHLNHKIDKLLNKLEENEPELATTQEEECVICINAKATMQTSPCGHQVVCRKCFVKTIQMAVSQRLLPLRCVICRAKILRLKQTGVSEGSARDSSGMPTSVSGYSVASSSGTSVPGSDSMYSVSSGSSGASENSLTCGSGCCQGRTCLGAYPRQPTGALKRSQQHAMKLKLQDYYHNEKPSVCRLPPIREMSPHAAPRANTAPASTRIRCAQKIVTQLETVPIIGNNSKNYFRTNTGYEKLPTSEPSPKRWLDRINKEERQKSEELVDNKKNELVEKKLVESEKQKAQREKEAEKQAKKEAKEEKKKMKEKAKAEKKS